MKILLFSVLACVQPLPPLRIFSEGRGWLNTSYFVVKPLLSAFTIYKILLYSHEEDIKLFSLGGTHHNIFLVNFAGTE